MSKKQYRGKRVSALDIAVLRFGFLSRRIKIERCGDWECWIWQHAVDRKGYGTLSYEGNGYRAHRISYELFAGRIPEGLVIDHLCRRTGCVNPEHLEPVTSAENTFRGQSKIAKHKRQTECINGHPLNGENVYLTPKGWRRCKKCLHKWRQEYDQRNQRVARRG